MFNIFFPIFSLVTGIVSAGWFLNEGLKSLVSEDYEPAPRPKLKPIDLRNTKSTLGHCHAENYGYYSPMKWYLADVVCQELNTRHTLSAKSLEELEKKIEKEYNHCEERIRDKINMKVIRKSKYFRIG